MHGFWIMVKEGGWGAMLALFFGFFGLLAGLGAGITLIFSRRAAFWVGLAALVIATLTAGVGLLGMMSGKRTVDAAIGGIEGELAKERIRTEGYKEAQGAAKVGFGAAVCPLFFGLLTVGLGARTRGRWISGGAIGFFALLTCGGALAASRSALPKMRFPFEPDDSDAWALAEALDVMDIDQRAGCDDLADALERIWQSRDKASHRRAWPRQFDRDPDTLIPNWRASATTCVRVIWADVQARGSSTRLGSTSSYHAPKTWTRDALLDSPLLVDDALHTEILAYEKPSGETDGGARTRASLRAGTVTVNGRLPPEVIQRIVRQHFGSVRTCYETALQTKPALEGTARVKLVIGRDGSVTSASDGGSDLADATAITCIVHAFSKLSFPEPEGGIVTVIYPIILTPSR